MNIIITKINTTLKRLLRQNGQGLTEFVLILAFCAAIGWAANKVGFLDAIGAVFDTGARPANEVAAIGGGTGTSGGTTPTEPTEPTEPTVPTVQPTTAGVGLSGFDWGVINPNTYFEQPYEDESVSLDGGKTHVNFETAEASQDDRLAADQKALENLARFFIGKTKEKVSELLKAQYLDWADMGAGKPADSIELNLGHIKLSNSMSSEGTGMRFEVTDRDGLKASEAENIFKWMVNPDNPESVVYKSDYNYLVSDYAVSQGWVSTIEAGDNQGNGLKLRLEYDYAGKYAPEGGYADANDVIVIGAHVAIDPKSQFNDKLGEIADYNRMTSQGLDVQVRAVGMDSDGKLLVQITYNNTGVPMIDGEVAVAGKAGTYNWYGEGDYKLVQSYFNSVAKYTLTEANQHVTVDRGDIIKKGDNWYIALKNVDTDLNKNSNLSSNDFLMIQRTDTYKYWHENDKTEDGPNIKTLKVRGTVFTKDNGDVFIYVGTKTSGKVNIVTDINESNSDWIKIGNLIQSEGEQDQGQGGTQTGGNGEIQSAPYQNIQVSYYDITVDNWDTIKTENKIKKGTIFKYNNKYYISLANDVSSLNFDNSDNGLFKNYNSTELKNVYYDKDYAGQSYPVLKSGDIVVVEGNGTYAFLNSGTDGSWYSYPINVNDGNLVKLFD